MISGGDGLLLAEGNSGESCAIRVRLDSEPQQSSGIGAETEIGVLTGDTALLRETNEKAESGAPRRSQKSGSSLAAPRLWRRDGRREKRETDGINDQIRLVGRIANILFFRRCILFSLSHKKHVNNVERRLEINGGLLSTFITHLQLANRNANTLAVGFVYKFLYCTYFELGNQFPVFESSTAMLRRSQNSGKPITHWHCSAV
ncbi:hypothetical protein DFH08DRAFT_826551 [Mycena albidolilacea]|uniref:Uncharacterized protein n=1 Tax=Mycena albidolilacea TaxID=1033008 RepID=A0AAD6Z100_9AGAR|nr:hypothetical protein DFH08DRAFT_826551 [Mycena albidolilacea]